MEYSYEAAIAWKNMDETEISNCKSLSVILHWFKIYEDVYFYFPNYEQSPWQAQCTIGDTVVNFWPHKMKAHREYERGPAAEGDSAIIELLTKTIEGDDDDFDVLE